jgi:prevent-host-death family protein
METYTANDAKQNLGKVIDTALREPVSITKHGRPAVIMTSDEEYQEYLAFKYTKLKQAVTAGFEQMDQGLRSKLSVDQIAERVLQRSKAGS